VLIASVIFNLFPSSVVIVVAKLGSAPRAAAISLIVSRVPGADPKRLAIAVSV